MKKRILSLFLCTCMIATVFVGCGSEEAFLKTEKFVQYYTYNDNTATGVKIGDIVNSNEKEYDKDGNLVSETIQLASTPIVTVKKEYDEEGILSSIKMNGDGEELEIDVVLENQYDEDGVLCSKVFYYEGMLIIEYDADNRIFREYDFESDSTHEYYYDENDNLVYETYMGGSHIFESKYEYHENGKKSSWKYYIDDTLRAEYLFDENENVISSKVYGLYGELHEESVYEYDENNNPLNCERYVDDIVIEKTIYEYDKNGNLLGSKTYSGDEVIGKTECEYDKYGNLLSKKTYIEDDILYTETTYTYFK